MKLSPDKRATLTSATVVQSFWLVSACSFLAALTALAAAPNWWSSAGSGSQPAVMSAQVVTNNDVVTTNYLPSPNAVVTQGQLKQFTARAVDYLNSAFATNGGAGPGLSNLIYGWKQDYDTNQYATNTANPYKPSDYQAVDVGQLKYIANLIYGQLSAIGYPELSPPWLHQNTTSDSKLAVQGQLKQLFDFNFSLPGATGLTETSMGTGDVNLTWTLPASNNTESWLVEQQNQDGGWSILTNLPDPDATSYSVSGLNPGVAYNFQVIGVGSATNSVSVPSAITGSLEGLLRETWSNLPGVNITPDLTTNAVYPAAPTTRDFPTVFESGSASDPTSNLGERVRGYVKAPITGNYQFFVSGGGNCNLLLGSSTDPATASLIASVPLYNYTSFLPPLPLPWYPSETSAPVSLTAGQSYYIEAVHKQGTSNPDGGDPNSLAVGWQLPNGTQEFPIQGQRLTPYVNNGGYMSEVWSMGANSGLNWANFTTPGFMALPQFRNIISSSLSASSTFTPGFLKASGWIYPPITGVYQLTLKANSSTEVNLSADNTPANKQTIISSTGGSNTSNGVTLTAGVGYYFEVLSQVNSPTDQVIVGWRLPNGSNANAIPQQYLAPNIQAGGAAWEFWTDISDPGVYALTTSEWYPNEPVSRTPVNRFEMQTQVAYSGSRIHGYVQAPETGNYTFQISGDDECQLLISSSTDPTLARAIADVPAYTGFEIWNQYSDQTSSPVPLQAGQWYYIEALEKNDHNGGFVSVAWTRPDGTFEGPIPGWRLNPAPGRDGNLPVVRITSPVNGATFNDSGQSVTVTATVQSLDRPIVGVQLQEDGVPIANLTGPNYQYTLSNVSAGNHRLTVQATDDLGETAHDTTNIYVFAVLDSDGLGIPNYEEINQLFIAPGSPEITGIATVATINSSTYSNISSTSDWQQNANGLISAANQGWVEYTVNLTSADIYRVLVQATPYLNSSPDTLLTLGVQIDGVQTDQILLPNASSPNQYAVSYTPYLPAGQHVIRLTWQNYNSGNAVIIKGLVVEQVEGPIDTATGMKQWVENRLAQTDTTTVAPLNNPVSPVCVEGTTQFFGEVAISNAVPVQHGTANKWYANIPLSATNPTSATIYFENGGRSDQKTFTWQPTDIMSIGQITIRQGDSLLLTANGGNLNTVPVTIQVPGQSQLSTNSATSAPYQFDQVGTFNVTANYFGPLPNRGPYNIQTGYVGTLAVTVVSANFDGYALAWDGRPRTWNCHDIPSTVTVEADPSIQFAKTPVQPATGSQFSALTQFASDSYVVARLYAGGPILANAPVRGFWLKSSDEAYLATVEQYPDGSQKIEMDVVVSLITSDMNVILQIDQPGVIFDDGTIEKTLTVSDFDSHNTAKVYFIVPSGGTSICHTLTVYQGGTYVGTR